MKRQLFQWLMVIALIFISSCGIKEIPKVDIFNPSDLEECRSLEEREMYSDIPLITDKEICLSNYGKITGDFTKCNDEEKPYCMGGVAAKSNNFSLCDDEYCFLAMGLSSNLDFCETFDYDEKLTLFIDFEQEARDICKLGAAVSNKDVSICKSFDDESYLNYYCNINVAKQTKNANICESLEEYTSQECFFVVALEKRDKSLCNKATERKQECQDILTEKEPSKN